MSSSMKQIMHFKIVEQFYNVSSLKVNKTYTVSKFSIVTKGLSCAINCLLRFVGNRFAYIHTINILMGYNFYLSSI